MNTKNLRIVVLVILLAVGGYFVVSNSGSKTEPDAMMVKEEDTNVDNGTMMKKEDVAVDRYVEYSKAALENAAAGRRVLFFYANWCSTCAPADKSFKENTGSIPSDLVVVRVNYNDTDTDAEEKELAKTYGITYQHTFVQIDAQGKEIGTWNGGQIKELLANIR